jgi:KDO2-lipid IV(A) lauroyltransferase
MMDRLLYVAARILVGILQSLPLTWVARLGRYGGAVVHLVDRRHRRVARENLRRCFGAEMSEHALRELERENFRRIGENFACAVKTASMTDEQIKDCLEWTGMIQAEDIRDRADGRGIIVAIGHFGNFELYARASLYVQGFRCATTYRGLRQPALDRLLQSMRAKSGCLYFERRADGEVLREALNTQPLMLGLLVDQHAGDRGLPARFFGQECSTSAAPGVYAWRYRLPLFTAVCYRIGLGRWRIEFGPEIPTRIDGSPRPAVEIADDINRAFEAAIRRDPANWFWVHRRWKPVQRRMSPAAASEEHLPSVPTS